MENFWSRVLTISPINTLISGKSRPKVESKVKPVSMKLSINVNSVWTDSKVSLLSYIYITSRPFNARVVHWSSRSYKNRICQTLEITNRIALKVNYLNQVFWLNDKLNEALLEFNMNRSNAKQIQSSKKMQSQQSPKMLEKMVCAGTAACTADIITFPLDVRPVQTSVKLPTNAWWCKGG